MRNVSRAWAYETGLAAGVELGPGKSFIALLFLEVLSTLCVEIPANEYYEYFGPDYELDVKSSNTDDLNSPAYLDRVKRIVLENLRHAGGPPSVQMSGMLKILLFFFSVGANVKWSCQISPLCQLTRHWKTLMKTKTS